MAEIHVQAKKHPATPIWVWIVVVLVIAGAIAYYLMTRNKTNGNNTPPANTTGYVEEMQVNSKHAFEKYQPNTVVYSNANKIC